MRRPLWAVPFFFASIVVLAPRTPAQELSFQEARILCPVQVRKPSVRSGGSSPLLVALHGRGGSGEGMLGIWDALREPRPIFAAPGAPYPLFLGGARPSLGRSWDFPSRDRRLWERADPLVVGYILDVIHRLQREHETGNVYLLGHSQGVAYAYMTAFQEPDTIRGVIAYAGILPADLIPDESLRAAAPKVKVLIAHGKKDDVVSPKTSEKARDRLLELGFGVTYRELPGDHSLSLALVRAAQSWINACEEVGTGQ